MQTRSRQVWVAAGVAGALWLLSGLVHVIAASNVYAGRALRLLVPSPTNAIFWSWPMPWSFLALLLAAVGIAAAVLVLSSLIGRSRSAPGFADVWISAVAAGAIVGIGIDAVSVLSSMFVVGWRAATLATAEYAVVGAYWGLVQGWIPALIALRATKRAAPQEAPFRRFGWSGVTVIVVLVAFVVVGTIGAQANQSAFAREQAIAEPRPAELGAAPDPNAEGTPPPAVAPSSERRDRAWCTPEQAMLLLGDKDAATGHRVLSIRIMNFSDAPCIINGYPDIAFADQNGNQLDVTIEQGSSFMAEDAGAKPIEVPSGGYAIAFIGWDANATAGALVASALYAAQVAGDDRGSWPVSLDITEGSSVEVTAWRLDEPEPAADTEG